MQESYEQLAHEFRLAVSLGRLDPTDRDRFVKCFALVCERFSRVFSLSFALVVWTGWARI